MNKVLERMEILVDGMIETAEEFMAREHSICIRGVVLSVFEECGFARHFIMLTDIGRFSVSLRRNAFISLTDMTEVWVVGELTDREHIIAESVFVPQVRQMTDLFLFRELKIVPLMFLVVTFIVLFPFSLLTLPGLGTLMLEASVEMFSIINWCSTTLTSLGTTGKRVVTGTR